ncbi:hypothetical protein [Ralstonia pseudosolanacearum]|uniref:hypothetical protein n=1 Tax=Ralstonia pseudosolanacearum TaxID=1310165 RepID=UPI001FF91040|nr:hypothetical protein [Ralstonia pseudosolanacearum]
MSERSEFAPFPARYQKFKEWVAISGAPFFAYFLWQDKESESAPAGDETLDGPQTKNPTQQKQQPKNNQPIHPGTRSRIVIITCSPLK